MTPSSSTAMRLQVYLMASSSWVIIRIVIPVFWLIFSLLDPDFFRKVTLPFAFFIVNAFFHLIFRFFFFSFEAFTFGFFAFTVMGCAFLTAGRTAFCFLFSAFPSDPGVTAGSVSASGGVPCGSVSASGG